MNEIAIFGGSFDPPHIGHVLMCAYALSMSPAQRVIVAPVYQHAFGKQLSPFDDRVAMCRIAFEPFVRVEVSEIERELGGTSFTIDLVEALKQRHPDEPLRFLMGADILLEAHKWKSFDRICALAPLLVAGRGGFPHPDVNPEAPALPEVSSSDIRKRLKAGEDVTPWVPPRVLAYIKAQALYTGAPA